MDSKILCTSKYFLFFSLLIIFCSCSNNKKNDEIFKALNESLENSNKLIQHATNTIMHSIQEKMEDPVTKYKATAWQPKAQSVYDLSERTIDFIGNIRTVVETEKQLPASSITELFNRLTIYKDSLMKIDTSMKFEFENSMILISRQLDSLKQGESGFAKIFYDLSPQATIAMLNKLENNIRVTEHGMVLFCKNKIPDADDFYDFYSVLVDQNSSYVRAGDAVEVRSGMGAFSRKLNPHIWIRGREIPLNSDGVAYYKFSAPDKKGKHYVPVLISFTGFDGETDSVKKTIEYNVIE
jgi:hypothetical protein